MGAGIRRGTEVRAKKRADEDKIHARRLPPRRAHPKRAGSGPNSYLKARENPL